MKAIIQDVIELELFDQEGKFVTKIDGVSEGVLDYKTDGTHTYLVVNDIFFNMKMLERIGEKVENNTSDFDKAVTNDEETVIKFKRDVSNPQFKIVARGITYDIETGRVKHDFRIIAPNAELVDGYEMNLRAGEVFQPQYMFKLKSYNDEKDVFELRIKDRK